MKEDLILSQSEYEHLLEEIHRLQARIIELTAQRDDLVYHVCPALQAEYEEKIACLERELLAAQMYLAEKQRIIELLQAQINRQKEPSFEEAKQQAEQEFRDYQEDLKRKAKEAEEFRNHWENDTRWAEHDRAEKAERTGQGTHQYSEEDSPEGAGPDGREAHKRIGMDGGPDDGQQDGRSADGKNDQNADDKPAEEAEKKQTPAEELKSLYRKIVKRLHPDVHPNPTEREKDLLNKAQEAMRTGDLETMRRIWEELFGADAPEESFRDTPEDLEKMRELLAKLAERIAVLAAEIDHIRSVYPYTMKSLLEDDKAVEEKRSRLQKEIDETRERDRQLGDYIDELRRKMRGEEEPGRG